MNRIDRLICHKEYIENMEAIAESEKNRSFCLHDFSHAMDVARICYIYNLEEKLGFEKDIIYAMALLHDIGRGHEYESAVPHHRAGASLAYRILLECGFDDDDAGMICEAIASHKHSSEGDSLKALLYRADKQSRSCFTCKMYEECYWEESLKNKTIIV